MVPFIKQYGWFVAVGTLGIALFTASSFFVVSNRESTIQAHQQVNAIHSLERFHRLLHEWNTLSREVGVEESLNYFYPAFRVQRTQLQANPLTADVAADVDRHVQRALQESQKPWVAASYPGLTPLQEAVEDIRLAGSILRASRSARLVEVQADWALSIRLLWLSFAVLVALVPLHLIRRMCSVPTPAPEPTPVLSERMQVLNQLPMVDALADHAEVGLAVLDRHGIITACNQTLVELLGYAEEELIGTSLAAHISTKTGEEALPSIAQHLVHRSGEEVRVRVSLTNVRNAEGMLAHTFVILEDVTAKQVAEALEAHLRSETERVHLIRESIVANVNHELRTPLSIIMGYTGVLKEEVGPLQGEFVEAIERSSKKLLGVVQNLLDFSEIKSGSGEHSLGPLDPRKVVSESLGAYRLLADEHGLRLSFHTPLKPLLMHGAAEPLRRIVGLLVDNAIKFTPQGYINVALEETSEDVVLHVRDTGVGMTAEQLAQVFEPFTQGSLGTTRTHEGTGLGLTLARGLVEQLNGALDITSTPSKGTTVTVRFPMAEAESVGVPNRLAA